MHTIPTEEVGRHDAEKRNVSHATVYQILFTISLTYLGDHHFGLLCDLPDLIIDNIQLVGSHYWLDNIIFSIDICIEVL